MATLRTAMDAAFWDFNISTPLTLDGVSRAIPGDPIPSDGARASKVHRLPQLALIKSGFPLGIFPSYSPSPNHTELGSFALQSVLCQAAFGNWWGGLVGQFRPKKLISSIKAEVSAAEEWELPLIKDVGKHIFDGSLYACGLFSYIALTSTSSLLFNTEKHGERNKWRTKAILLQNLPNHDISIEAAWPELFIDKKGKYWDVPASLSWDCSSLASESGLRYRFGIRKNSILPESIEALDDEVPPLALMPGICAKAAVSYEKKKDFWRQKYEKKEDESADKEKDEFLNLPYDIRLREPHAAISGIIGGTCEAWVGSETDRRGRFGADSFGAACYTFQRGKFSNLFGDLSRIDARLDIGSASGFIKKVSNLFKSAENCEAPNALASPRLNLIFQQQVYGPIVFRLDSKLALDSAEMEDLRYSLSYSLRMLNSGKVVAWYSPKRKEGMIELRMFEF